MKIAVIKTDGCRLIPAYDSDMEFIKKLPKNVPLEIKINKSRNLKFHKKFFALIKLVHENQEKIENIEHLRKYITIKAGYYDEVNTGKGMMILPKSIKFSKMDNIEFSKLYDNCLSVINKEFSFDSDLIEKNISDFY